MLGWWGGVGVGGVGGGGADIVPSKPQRACKFTHAGTVETCIGSCSLHLLFKADIEGPIPMPAVDQQEAGANVCMLPLPKKRRAYRICDKCTREGHWCRQSVGLKACTCSCSNKSLGKAGGKSMSRKFHGRHLIDALTHLIVTDQKFICWYFG